MLLFNNNFILNIDHKGHSIVLEFVSALHCFLICSLQPKLYACTNYCLTVKLAQLQIISLLCQAGNMAALIPRASPHLYNGQQRGLSMTGDSCSQSGKRKRTKRGKNESDTELLNKNVLIFFHSTSQTVYDPLIPWVPSE